MFFHSYLTRYLMNNKQKIELFYAEPILKHLGIEDAIVSADSPDIRYSYNGRTIGIEVVSCYPEDEPGSFTKMESRVLSACREYAKKLKREGAKGLCVWVSFSDAAYQPDKSVPTNLFKKIVLEEIDRKTAQFKCEQRMTTPEGRNDYFDKMAAGVFDCKYIESVSIDCLNDCDFVHISPVRTGYIMPLESKFVLNCLEKKEKKLERYKELVENRDISEYWLFVYNPGDTFRDLEDFKMPKFKSSYDRVYLTDRGRVLQLK